MLKLASRLTSRSSRIVSASRTLAASFSAAAPDAAELAFRRFGHLEADVDPLRIAHGAESRPELNAHDGTASAAKLREVYCGKIGAEFEHIDSAEERKWFAEQLEAAAHDGFNLTLAQKKNAGVLLTQADVFENFLAKKYPTLKRYSGEGCESLIPALDNIFATAAANGVSDVVIGMAHRGRLALLVSLLGYPARKLFHKINGFDDIPADVQGIDDVSSHIAASIDRTYGLGAHARKVHVSLLHNPSHLEAVNPVAAGKTRAKRDQGSTNAMCLLVHGDAAVYGQGVVAETYAMGGLPGYDVGGTVHVITNNQVGFTAEGKTSRSSRYASDMAKVIGAPVLHVNAESMRDVVLATSLAVKYRAAYGKDVVIDLIGYRRYGHNELDEPRFTQPLMYKHITHRPPFATTYAQSLVEDGSQTEAQQKAIVDRLNAHLEAEFQASKAFTKETGSLGLGDASKPGAHVIADGTAYAGNWQCMKQATEGDMLSSPDTGYPIEDLRRIGAQSVTVPEGFTVHDRLVRGHVNPRLQALGFATAAAKGAAEAAASFNPSAPTIDWATAEAMAFGRVLHEGRDVRMSGQDAQRGTFSHRHAVLVDQNEGTHCTPLEGLAPKAGVDKTGKLRIFSSFLSEFGVLGFEYGYSWESPSPLVLWEAQFGDFANGAQIIIDQFISGSESKWLRQSGLVMLLPHGFDGAGPEHSSARIERFLQLVNSQAFARGSQCVDPAALAAHGHKDKSLHESTNLIVAYPTTPANYYHLLVRQAMRSFRKPAVVITPKTLLRDPAARSPLTHLAPGTSFQPVLGEAPSLPGPAASDVKRVVLVSGKLHMELANKRQELINKGGAAAAVAASTTIVRVEELAPFPTETIVATLQNYSRMNELFWVQEEPSNAGAWTFAEAHLTPALAKAGMPSLKFVGRPALAAPAVGLSKYNKAQQEFVLARALQ